MSVLRALCFVLMAPGFLWAQASPPKTDSSTLDSDVAAELKAVREALSQTQKQMASQEQALREALSQTQKQMAAQQQEIEALKSQSRAEQTALARNEQPARLVDVSAPATVSSSLEPVDSGVHGTGVVQPLTQAEGQKGESPLSFKIGSADIRLGGFVDVEDIFRTTNTQNNIATNFAAIPFSNTTQGQLSEYRLTAQFSRFSIQVTDKFGANNVTGYCEADFSGNDATNVYQTVNGHTLRMRLCFMRVQRSKWEILGGQTWSWLTPNRVGIGPNPAELAITYNEDQNIGVGLPYTRAAEFRIAYHLNDHLAFGVGIEDPNQYICLLYTSTPKEQSVPHAQDGGAGSVLTPYKIVFSNPQSYLCGIIAGLMFAPTTIGDMIWGVASFQKDLQFSYHNAVLVASMVPLGWVFGCPLLGWLSDRIGRRKPVIMGSATVMILAGLQLALKPLPIPPHVAMFIFGVASGAAMIPYSVIKEVNPDNAKGSATGGINFLVFAITAFLGPVYAKHIGKGIGTATDLHLHFQKGAFFWIACCAAAIVVSFFLRETGPAAHGQVQAK